MISKNLLLQGKNYFENFFYVKHVSRIKGIVGWTTHFIQPRVILKCHTRKDRKKKDHINPTLN